MSDSPGNGPAGAGAPRRGWVRRHKVYAAIIALSAVGTLGTFLPSNTADHPAPVALASPSPSPHVAVATASPRPSVKPAAKPSPTVRRTVASSPTHAATTVPRPVAKPKAASLTCVASVSNSSPAQYSTVDVYVRVGRANIGVTATAHYKSKDTTNTGTTAADGQAAIPFKISRATLGYTVVVDVQVSGGPSCQTSFTPQ